MSILRRLAEPTLVFPRPIPRRLLLPSVATRRIQYASLGCRVSGRRFASTQAEDESGHISAGPNEGIFFIESPSSGTMLIVT